MVSRLKKYLLFVDVLFVAGSSVIALRGLFIRLGSGRAESVPITWCPVSVSYLLDSTIPSPSLILSLCVPCPLVIRPGSYRAESFPVTKCPVSVS